MSIKNIRMILFILFSRQERRQLYWLCVAILAMAIIEVAGIASIMPFMTVVANPEIIQTNKYLNSLYSSLGFQNANTFIFFIGLAVLTILVASNAFSAFTTWLLLRFTNMRGHTLSERLLIKYLNEPYTFFLNRSSTELSKNILAEVSRTINGVLIPGMQMLAKLIVIVFILILLLTIEPLLMLAVVVVLGGVYVATFSLFRRKLATIGRECFEAGAQRHKLANEALGGIKDIKILGREFEFIKRYSSPSQLFAKHEASNQIIAILPRYVLESVTFSGILLIVLYLISAEKDISHILSLVSLYAFAGYRLMPALQHVFAGATSIRYSFSSLYTLCSDLSSVSAELGNTVSEQQIHPMSFENQIELDEITFTYPNIAEPVMEKLSLSIKINTTIGLVGRTGAGKTTIVDIILGLLLPNQGKLIVDVVEVNTKNVRNWQKNLGYVLQDIYLSDDTITRNIAFGIRDEDIDQDGVERAAKIANVHNFIVRDLPHGYQTLIGERGTRLSGGQRQRIGIARALYHDPKVLIFDEATSSLDGITEGVILEAIRKLSHKKTIIIIAHRLSTVKECDIIYILEKGKIVDQGTYAELIESNPQFRSMASVK